MFTWLQFQEVQFPFLHFLKIVVNSQILNIFVLENTENVKTMYVVININILHVFFLSSLDTSSKAQSFQDGFSDVSLSLFCIRSSAQQTFCCCYKVSFFVLFLFFQLFHLLSFKSLIKKQYAWGASPVAQWLRILLPMQGTWVRSLGREDPTCYGATKPVLHSY